MLEFALTHKLGLYDWFPPVALGSEAIDLFCVLESAVCENLMSELFDPEIDNIPRYEMGVGDLPSGQTYRAMAYYAQSVNGSYKFSMYDYGPIKNK